MKLRAYNASDAARTLEIFESAVREIAGHDYTPAQVEAWLGDGSTVEAWNRARMAVSTCVVQTDRGISGFIDVDQNGYIDMLFVAPREMRRGLATALVSWAETTARAVGAEQLSTYASVTARPFFEARGFNARAERSVIVRGVELTNFAMTRRL